MLTAATCHADNFDNILLQAKQQWADGKISDASGLYLQLCAEDKLAVLPTPRRAQCHHYLAGVEEARDDSTSAATQFRLAVDTWVLAGPEYSSALCVTLANQAEFYRRQHRLPEAEKAIRQAVDLARPLETTHPELSPQALSRLGFIYQETNQLSEALVTLRQATERFASLTPPHLAEEAFAVNALGMVELAKGLQSDAETHLRRALDLSSKALGEDHPETATCQANLALALIARGEYARAGALLRRAQLITEASLNRNDILNGLILAELSSVAEGENKLALAEEYGKKALAVLKVQSGPNTAAVALAQVNLAQVYVRARHFDEANSLLPGAIELERQTVPGTRLLADGLRRLAEFRALQHSWLEAAGLFSEAIGLYEKLGGPNNPFLVPVLRGRADALRHATSSKAEVRTLESRAKSVASFLPR